MLFGSASTMAQSDCQKMAAEAGLQLIAAPAPGVTLAVGGVTYLIDDQPRLANVTVSVVDMRPPTDDGTLHVTAQMYHDFMDGDSLTWRGDVVLSPEAPGEYRLNERAHLVASTGTLTGLEALGTGHGHVSMNNFTANIGAKGWLCPGS